ncbi:MAG: hypothetical protein WC663_00155 [Patescibacteria group bacterium]|jgi:hypothetical protein
MDWIVETKEIENMTLFRLDPQKHGEYSHHNFMKERGLKGGGSAELNALLANHRQEIEEMCKIAATAPECRGGNFAGQTYSGIYKAKNGNWYFTDFYGGDSAEFSWLGLWFVAVPIT